MQALGMRPSSILYLILMESLLLLVLGLLAGNILMANQNPTEAEPLFRELRKDFPDSPGPMISLGLAYQMQGRFIEAAEVYDEFTYLFDEIFPNIVTQIRRNRYLMEEGFSSPPKWEKIYRYQLMHEL